MIIEEEDFDSTREKLSGCAKEHIGITFKGKWTNIEIKK